MEKKVISGKVRVNNASFNSVVNASSVDFKSSIVNNDNINACVAERGAAGFSPIANVVKSGDDVTITITDYKGTTTATIPDMSDEVERIESLIPHTASPTNKLVDTATLNSSVQTATSNFRGDWATYADIPADASLYPVDAAGVRTPTTNDYLVVMTDEEQNGGTWRYKYVGLWSVDGKNGWQAEYQVNETPFTADQLAAINSGITSELVEEIGQGGGGTGLQMFDTILKDHVLTYEESNGLALQGTYVYKEAVAGSRYGYPDFYNKCLEEKEGATATEVTLGDNTITMYVNSNGHQFYDIADKEAVDIWFETYGFAWFYGIDTENERVFLPRNNYFAIKGSVDSVDVDVFGTGKTLGLTNGEQNIGLITYSAGVIGGMTGCYNKNYGTGTGGDWNRNQKAFGVVKDATKSGLTGKADTSQVVQIDDTKYLYICVGNTEVTSTVTDVVEVTTTENDTIPLGYSVYQANGQPSVSWLKSQGQWNDGNVYVTFYNEFVNKLGQDFASGKVVEVTDEYTDYDLVINQTDMTFRLPLLDGSESVLSDKYDDLTLGASGSTYTAPANGYFTISKLTNGTNQNVTLMNTGKDGSFTTWGTHIISRCVNPVSGGSACTFIPASKGDIIRVTYTTGGNLEGFRFIYAQGNGSLYFKVANAVQNLELLDAGEVMEAVAEIASNAVLKTENKAYITETYQNGTSWYRLYSDGWCEQGGRGALNEVATTTITLLKPYKDTNYSVSAVSITASTAGDTEAGLQCTPKSTTQITLTAHYLNPNNQTACWEAKGYIA